MQIMPPLKVAIVGSGAWGSAISRIVGENAQRYPNDFDTTVKMWVFEEMVNDRKLSEIINQDHENVKYLPGKKLPVNVVAVTDLLETTREANILIFVIPHQFINKCCTQMAGKINKDAIGVSLIKGLGTASDGSGRLISSEIRELLGIEVSVLMGANLAHEVADDQFCEATIGAKSEQTGSTLKKLFHTKNFRVCVVRDAETVEVCGALKNVVACGAGFSDGLGYGDNTKAAIIRLGLMEMIKYIGKFHGGGQLSTYFESCGVADLVTTCHGGRNRKCAEAFVKTGKPLEEIEKELLGGQRLQGPETAAQAYKTIQTANAENEFPLFVAVHKICMRQMDPKQMIELLKDHPAHM